MTGFRNCALAALALCIFLQSSAAQPPQREHWNVRGLERPAQLVIDRWGIPHIFAGTRRDAFFLQGYNAARDRLWQIDLWRKRGLGLLAASFGPAYIAQDRASRLFLYRGDMAAEWNAYAPGTRDAVQAFVEGINAFVREVRAGTRPLPVEFRLTASSPDLWDAGDVVRIRSHALVSNLTSEVARARVVCLAGVEADRLRRKLEPPHRLAVPEGLDPCSVPDEALADYRLGTGAVDFTPLVRSSHAENPRREGGSKIPDRIFRGGAGNSAALARAAEGSNNWVISPARSATGHAVLANDPHRALGVPALRYLVELSAPGIGLIGAGEPALPGVALGHNDHAAWGITIFNIDQEDLYVYALKPGDPDFYRYGNGWERMRVVRETLDVKGGPPSTIEMRFTRHGPVLFVDRRNNRAFALRTVWNAPGASGYLGSSRMWDAASWSDFLAAREHWGAPPLNLVYADTAGNIGWAPGGLTPVRPGWDGLLPVPGDGRYEWRGFLTPSRLGAVENPKEGWFATANEMNLPLEAQGLDVSYEWSDPSRITRIKTVLGAHARLSLSDSMALQTDTHSAESARLIALLAPLRPVERNVREALSRLRSWNGDETTSSIAAAIYEVWVVKHLPQAVAAKLAPAAASVITGPGQSLDAVVGILENPDAAFGPDPVAVRDRLLASGLAEAVSELEQRLGPDQSLWTWGKLHHALFEPAAAVLADPDQRARMTVGPLPLPGSASSPRAATWRASDFAAISGASVRMVLDTGDWDRSMAINTPGESGDPESPHYRDLFPLWASGKYVPLLYSRDAVLRVAETVIDLSP
ncbi:MAG: penicillin acylase family protein [Alphaproteobacteria bacterium]|nr:penicillin acylase family protein [Alphaproteobacteria bacterium]